MNRQQPLPRTVPEFLGNHLARLLRDDDAARYRELATRLPVSTLIQIYRLARAGSSSRAERRLLFWQIVRRKTGL